MSAAPADRNAADRLRALRAETEADVRALDARIDAITAARADANSDDEHDPEGATIGFERAQDDALRSAAHRRIMEIDAALGRVAAGTYGMCAVCGEAIPPSRLEARPSADRCLQHATSVR